MTDGRNWQQRLLLTDCLKAVSLIFLPFQIRHFSNFRPVSVCTVEIIGPNTTVGDRVKVCSGSVAAHYQGPLSSCLQSSDCLSWVVFHLSEPYNSCFNQVVEKVQTKRIKTTMKMAIFVFMRRQDRAKGNITTTAVNCAPSGFYHQL